MNRQLFLVLAFVVIVIFLGLATVKLYEARDREVGSGVTLLSFDQISLERRPCYGSCPAYRVSVSGTGNVTYEGYTDVEHVGTATKQLDADAVKRLVSALNDAKVFGFRDSYRSVLDGCPSVWSDSATVITSISVGERVKRIDHYLGCGAYDPDHPERHASYPIELIRLEEQLDEIIGTREWTGWPRSAGPSKQLDRSTRTSARINSRSCGHPPGRSA